MDSSLNRLKTWIPATIQSFKLPLHKVDTFLR